MPHGTARKRKKSNQSESCVLWWKGPATLGKEGCQRAKARPELLVEIVDYPRGTQECLRQWDWLVQR